MNVTNFLRFRKWRFVLKHRLQGTEWLDKKMLKSKSAKCNSVIQERENNKKIFGTDY